MKQITKQQLAEKLMQLRGNSYMTLHTRTDATPKKTGNPYKKIEKIAKVKVQAGFKYKNSVDNQAEREGVEAQEVKPRSWGERINGTPLVFYKGRHYLEAKVEQVLEDVVYLADGEEVEKVDIEHLLPAKKAESSTQSNLKKKIILRDYKMESIKKAAFGGEVFEVI